VIVFPQKAKIAQKSLGIATSSRHNSAMITNAENSRLNDPLRDV